ncbi:hypothetical protein PGT21_033861 [Puccinia graminis f. sp. tritici]|uniref:Uncharacterized protein n=1 Tax=Puccinia graminis f. sp. tritici TaxID=56615 RepID=A0A5B0QY67_PUCGR|nr:hypothetical protein PGT21_033861 [Puccinia graminis f. sp. tritici]
MTTADQTFLGLPFKYVSLISLTLQNSLLAILPPFSGKDHELKQTGQISTSVPDDPEHEAIFSIGGSTVERNPQMLDLLPRRTLQFL